MSSMMEYFIKRQNCLPEMGKEIEFIVLSDAVLEEIGLPRKFPISDLTSFRGFDVLPSDAHSTPTFMVKLKGEQHIEDWYDAFRRDRTCATHQELIKNYQRMQARRTARALFDVATRHKEQG